MNWLFEAYSNVYNTAMGQRPLHHQARQPDGGAEAATEARSW